MGDATRRERFDRERTREDKRAAEELGYALLIEAIPNIEPMTHAAFATPLRGDRRERRFLTHGTSEADAAMNGRQVLEAIVLGDWPWPDPDLAYKRDDSDPPTVKFEWW